MKKTLALLVALVLAMGMFASLAMAEADKPYAGQEITFWMQKYGADPANQAKMLDQMTAEFLEKTGIKVTYSIIDWGQAYTKYTLAMTGGEAPDVADTFFAYSWKAIGGDQYGPMTIDDIVADVGSDGFYEFAKPECYVDGHWVALPWRGDTRFAAYNTQMFKDAGITEFPKTYDEIVKVAQKLTTFDSAGNVDRAGLLFNQENGRFDQTYFAVLAGFGGKVMNDDYTQFTIDTEASHKALQFMQDCLYKYKLFPTTVLDPTHKSTDSYAAGKAAIVLGNGPGMLQELQNNAPQIAEVTASAVMPSESGEGPSSIAFAAPVCVFNSTKHPEAAKEWLKFFCNTDNQVTAMKDLALVSVWKNVMSDPFFSSDWYKACVEQNTRAVPGDMPLPEWSQVDAFPNGPLNTMCTAVMAGNDVDTAIKDCMTAIDEIMKG
jgi:multiple sugar transport system substrate-binding protein